MENEQAVSSECGIDSAHGIGECSVAAVIHRADGRVEDLGVIARTKYWCGFPIPSVRDLFQGVKRKLIAMTVFTTVFVLAFCLLGGLLASSIGFAFGATLIVNGGHAIVTNLVSGLGGTVPKYIAWGTAAGTTAATDTTLFTETTEEARTTGTVSRVTTTVANDTFQVVGTITVATSNKTITNVGLFDVVTSSSGNLYFKSDFTGLALNIGDSITFTIKVKFS